MGIINLILIQEKITTAKKYSFTLNETKILERFCFDKTKFNKYTPEQNRVA